MMTGRVTGKNQTQQTEQHICPHRLLSDSCACIHVKKKTALQKKPQFFSEQFKPCFETSNLEKGDGLEEEEEEEGEEEGEGEEKGGGGEEGEEEGGGGHPCKKK